MNSDLIRIVSFCLLFAFQPTLQAETTKTCAELSNDSERLACYDQLAAPAGKTEPVDDGMEGWDRRLQTPADSGSSLLNERWELRENRGKFVFRPYKPVYFFPLFYSSDPNQLPTTPNPRTTVSDPLNVDSTEAKFQLSFKTKIGDNLIAGAGDLWLGYTQTSRWQIYSQDESRPFRETNHADNTQPANHGQ